MLMRTDPFRDLDRLTQQVFGTLERPAAIPMDAYRQGDQFVVHFDLPGVDADNIDLTVERNVLTVRATRGRTHELKGKEMVVSERQFGTFSRQLFLGETLDAERLEANYDAGVLTVTIPVAEQAKPRRVAVTTGAASNGAREISVA